jgi:ubiquinone/menaquinone biosynthesis C-methylase UbiE
MAYEELKQRQSVMWGNGPYQRVTETLTDIHERVISSLAPAAGDRWLDVACGTGAIAERAAAAGADVTGLDLAPALIETAQARAAEQGLDIEYMVGDAENLPFEDGSFGKVSSTFGIMFAPDHEAVARELARVTEPGGRLLLANWTPQGGLGKMFKVMAPYQPAPPPSSPSTGATSPACGSFSATRSTWTSRNMSRRFGCRRPSITGSSSPRATGRRRRSQSRWGTGARSCTETGSSSSRRTTPRTGKSSTLGNTC